VDDRLLSRSWFWQQYLAIRTICIAAAGGYGFVYLHVPLGWLLGSMLAVIAVTICFVKTSSPGWVRDPSLVVLGSMLGCTFSAKTIAAAAGWLPSLGAMAATQVVLSVIIVLYFRWISRYDNATAYYAGVCGVITQATVCAAAAKADVPRVAVSHGMRIVALLVLIPMAAQHLPGTGQADAIAAAVSGGIPPNALNLVLLVPCGAAGMILAGMARVPAPQLLGPMMVFGILSAAGVTEGGFPPIFINIALAGLGISIGARFAGVSVPSVFGMMFWTAPAITLLCISLGAATYFTSWTTGFTPAVSLLILAPSGVAEMALVAVACGIDPALVAAHHAIRIALTLPAIPVLAPLFAKSKPPQEAQPEQTAAAAPAEEPAGSAGQAAEEISPPAAPQAVDCTQQVSASDAGIAPGDPAPAGGAAGAQ
jgi:membrane AbrB-like protein